MTHARTALGLAVLLLGSGCFRIVVGETIPGSPPDSGALPPADAGTVAQDSAPPSPLVALDARRMGVALRVKTYAITREPQDTFTQRDVLIYEGDVRDDGSAFEVRSSTLRMSDQLPDNPLVPEQVFEPAQGLLADAPAITTWPRTADLYPTTVEAGYHHTTTSNLYLSATANGLWTRTGLGEAHGSAPPQTYSMMRQGSEPAPSAAAAYVLDDTLELAMLPQSRLRIGTYTTDGSFNDTPDGSTNGGLQDFDSFRRFVDVNYDHVAPESLSIARAGGATTWSVTGFGNGVAFSLSDVPFAPAAQTLFTSDGEEALRDVSAFWPGEVPSATQALSPAVLLLSTDVALRFAVRAVSRMRPTNTQALELTRVHGISNLATGPCSPGSERQCAFVVTAEVRVENLMEAFLHRFEWTGESQGANLMVHSESRLSVASGALPPSVEISGSYAWRPRIAAGGGVIATRFDNVIQGDDPPPGAEELYAYRRNGLYVFHAGTGVTLARRTTR